MRTLSTILVLGALAGPLGAQTVITGFTQNPSCTTGSPTNCATRFAPSGNALAARNSFFGSLNNSVATNSFETVAPGTSAPLTLNFGFAGNATLTGTGAVEAESPTVIPFGRFASSGSRYWQGSADGNVSFGISFSQRVAAFGFYGIDLGDVGGSVSVRLFDGMTLLNTLVVQPQVGTPGDFVPTLNGGMRFWGVLFGSNVFNRVEFVLTGLPEDADFFAFDDLTVADATQVTPPNVVPEPSTYLLMATGLAGLAALRRRRTA